MHQLSILPREWFSGFWSIPWHFDYSRMNTVGTWTILENYMRCPTDHFIWQLFVFQANSRWVAWCITMQLCHYYGHLWKGLPFPGDCRAAILYSVQRQWKAEGAYNELCHEALKMLFLWSKNSGHHAEAGWLKIKIQNIFPQNTAWKQNEPWLYPLQGIPPLKEAWAP